MNDPLETSSLAPSRRRFQFSLRSLFIFSFLAILFSAGIFSHYTAIQLWTLLFWMLVYQAITLSLAIYGKGYLRTFCIGAFISFSILSLPQLFLSEEIFGDQFRMGKLFEFGNESSPDDWKFYFPAISALLELVCSALFGGTMVLTRWLIEGMQRREADASNPPIPPADSAMKSENSETVKELLQ